jgi:hypothetical protein
MSSRRALTLQAKCELREERLVRPQHLQLTSQALDRVLIDTIAVSQLLYLPILLFQILLHVIFFVKNLCRPQHDYRAALIAPKPSPSLKKD